MCIPGFEFIVNWLPWNCNCRWNWWTWKSNRSEKNISDFKRIQYTKTTTTILHYLQKLIWLRAAKKKRKKRAFSKQITLSHIQRRQTLCPVRMVSRNLRNARHLVSWSRTQVRNSPIPLNNCVLYIYIPYYDINSTNQIQAPGWNYKRRYIPFLVRLATSNCLFLRKKYHYLRKVEYKLPGSQMSPSQMLSIPKCIFTNDCMLVSICKNMRTGCLFFPFLHTSL